MDGNACRCCAAPKEKGCPFCKTHKASYQCLERKAKKKTRLGEYVDPQQAEAFDAIFGKGREPPPNLTLANKVVLDFADKCPPAAASGRTARRGALDLTTFIHTKGSFQERSSISDDAMLEEDIFVNHMRTLRGWSQSHAAGVWFSFHSAPNADNDNGGWNNAPRTRIPSNLLGNDKARRSSGEMEQRVLQHSLKQTKNMSQDLIGDLMQATSCGFSHLTGSQEGASFHTMPSGGAGTRVGDSPVDDVFSLLASAVSELRGQPNSVDSVPAGGGQAQATVAPRPSEESATKPSPSKCDPVIKNKAVRTAIAELAVEDKRLVQVLKVAWLAKLQADPELDKDNLEVLEPRLYVGIHCHGSTPLARPDVGKPERVEDLDMQPNDYVPWSGEQTFTKDAFRLALGGMTLEGIVKEPSRFCDNVWAAIITEGAESVKLTWDALVGESFKLFGAATFAAPADWEKVLLAHIQESKLKVAVNKCVYLPMESTDIDPMSLAVMSLEVGRQQCSTADELESLVERSRAQRVLVSQMVAAIKAAASDLAGVLSKRRAASARRSEDIRRKKLEEYLRADRIKAEEGRKQLGKVRKVEPFKLDGSTYGFVDSKQYDGDEAFQDAFKADEVDFTKPFVVRASAKWQALTIVGTPLRGTLDRWVASFGDSAVAKQHDIAHARLLPAAGGDDFDSVLSFVCPTQVRSNVASVARALDNRQLYGHTSHFLQSDSELGLMHSLRMQFEGTTDFLAIPAADIITLMEKAGESVTALTLASFPERLNETTAAAAKGVALIVKGQVTAGSMMVLPAGWVLLQATHGEDKVTGIRGSFVPKDAETIGEGMAQIKALYSAGLTGYCKELLDALESEAGKLTT